MNSSTSNGAQIQQWPYVDGSNQKWQLSPADGSYFEVLNVLSGKALDDTGGSTSDTTLIQQWDWLNGDNQKWQFIPVDNGQYFAIQNKLSGKVLDDTNVSTNAGTRIQQYTYLGGDNQKWQLVPVYVNYEIVNAWSGKVLDIVGGSTSNGASIQEWDFLGGSNQKWQIVSAVDNTYAIRSLMDGKVLDDPFSSTQPGTAMQQYDYLSGANQQWYINDVNDPFYQIVNSQSALSLEVTATADGTLLQQDQFAGDVNQQWRLMVDGSLPVSSSGSDPAPPSVIGISSIAYIDENHISTYSATEVDYETAAYYDTYVETCLYQDGSQVSCANQTSSPGASAAGGYLNVAIAAGPHYQLQTNHYLVAPFAYVSAGVNYYYNPYGYGYASDGGGYTIDDSVYWTAGAAVYIGYADIYLGSTGVDAYTPPTEFSRGDLQGALTNVQYNGDGTYNLTLNGPGWDIGYEDSLLSGADVLRTGACVSQPELCAIVAGTSVVIYIAPKLGKLIQDIWEQWKSRKQAPFPYPGNDGTVAPGPNWTWKGNGSPGRPQGNWTKVNPDGTKESLHPDLNHPDPIGPHWDYKDVNGDNWRIWPDGTMSPKE